MAAPTFQAAGAPASNATLPGTIAPAWPAHVAGDIGLLIVESGGPVTLQTPEGFREVPASPLHDILGSTNYARMSVFWCRATSGAMAAPTVWCYDNRVRGLIVTVRGCGANGVPWHKIAGLQNEGVGDTAVACPAITTTEADVLVMAIVGARITSTLPQFSAWTNASLTGLTEQVDTFAGVGQGSGIGVATGVKAAAGAVNQTTATIAVAGIQNCMTIGFAATDQPAVDDTTPYVHGFGEPATSATVDVSPAWPPHQANDIGLLFVEAPQAATLAVAAGFTELPSSPQQAGVAGSASGTALSVFWKRATGAAEGAPTVNFDAGHVRAQIITVRGAKDAGDPWDVQAGGVTPSSSTSVSFPNVTTTKNNTRVINATSHSTNSVTMRFTGYANAALSEITEHYDWTTTIGNGSGLVLASGKKPTAGVVGSTTGANNLSSHQAKYTIAFEPPADVIPHEGMEFNTVFNDATLKIERKIIAETMTTALTINDLTFVLGQGFVLSADRLTFNSVLNPVTFKRRLGRWRRIDPSAPRTWTKRPPEES